MTDGSWYRTGTVSLTNGSDLVNGVGTEFIDNVLLGGIFFSPQGLYEVGRVVSNTQLQLVSAYAGPTAAGAAFQIAPTQGAVVAATRQLQVFLSELGPLKQAWEAGDLVAKGLSLKGVQESYEALLLLTGNKAGDGWLVGSTLYVWTGTYWHDSGSIVNTPELQELRADTLAAAAAAHASELQSANAAAHSADSAAQASESADRAETADASALLKAGLFVDAAAGIAGTAPGRVFGIPSASDASAIDLIANVGGVATPTNKSIANADAVEQNFIDFATAHIRLATVVIEHHAFK